MCCRLHAVHRWVALVWRRYGRPTLSAGFRPPRQSDKCRRGSFHHNCRPPLILEKLDSDSRFRPLEIRPIVASGSGAKRTRFKSFVCSPSPPTNARSIWIEAVAAVRLFEVERWQAARMAPRFNCVCGRVFYTLFIYVAEAKLRATHAITCTSLTAGPPPTGAATPRGRPCSRGSPAAGGAAG